MFTIQFIFPDHLGGVCYAGKYKDALGFAPTLETAILWPTREIAERFLINGYGDASVMFGGVIEVTHVPNRIDREAARQASPPWIEEEA